MDSPCAPVVSLAKSTRDGDREIAILTNLQESAATATQVAGLYRKRWSIERMFQEELERAPSGEIDTLKNSLAATFMAP